MSHLNIETLARLIDEAPDSHEQAHLEICDECRGELEGLKADAAALAQLPEIQPRAAQWRAIQHRLIAEGLLQPAARLRAEQRWFAPLLQLAAAIVIFVLGTYSAPLFRRDSFVPVAGDESDRGSPVSGTANNRLSGTTADAAATVRQAEQEYLAALTQYAELVGSTQIADPVARLAALESILLTTRAALGQAPADPVINGYHLTAMAQKEATIKRLQTSGEGWF